MNNSSHLSEEAVAACADGVLSGTAQDRATRHIASCAECAQAVKVQREAVWALRAAPAPPLPAGLFDRLREVPLSTPIRTSPTAIGPDGSAVLSNIAPMAAFVPSQDSEQPRGHRTRNVAFAAAAVALAGAVAAGSVAHADSRTPQRGSGRTPHAGSTNRGGGVQPVTVFRQIGR
jgi:anti-sigma factor RsiW